MVSAEEEFNITKLQLLEADKAKARREYERREAAVEVRKKVEYSKQLNESRIRVLQAREDAVAALLRDAHAALAAAAADASAPAYAELLSELAVQGMRKLAEPRVVVRCRAADAGALRALLPRLGAAFAARHGGDAPGVELDEGNPLPPPPKAGAAGEGFDTWCGRTPPLLLRPATLRASSRGGAAAAARADCSPRAPAPCSTCRSAGGVVVTSGDGKIVCSNTLDDRLRITYGQNLPAIRRLLFEGTEA
jgi:V-type H+-transporting ATPase subunit E